MRAVVPAILAAAIVAASPHVGAAQSSSKSKPILAVFAHPDDERVIGPLISKLTRNGREVHLVIATDGSEGVRDYFGVPAGAQLAAVRAKEAQCAATRLGVRQLHMLGLKDGGLASFEALGRLRAMLKAIVDSLRPAAAITFGPEGGTGHPDHRLVGDVMTQVIENDARYLNVDLLYATLPSERLRNAPPAEPTVNGVAEAFLTARVRFDEQDLVAGREEFACHRSQYTPDEMAKVNAYLAYAWNGEVWMRPWNGTMYDSAVFK
jgi:LmbE family N-acetylglucosaminyl deacetylase